MVDKILDKINTFLPEKWRWVLLHGGFRKYFKNTGWMFLGQFVSMFASFVATIIIARRLGPENYGQLSYAVSLISIFAILASFGIESILYRDLIENREKRYYYLGSAFVIRFITGLFTIILTLLFVKFFVNDQISKILVLILSGTFILGAFKIVSNEFQAQVKSKYLSISTVVIAVIINLCKIYVVLSGQGIIYLALIILFESILYAGFYLFFYKTKIKEEITDWRFKTDIAKKLIKDSWPVMFMSAFALIYARIDQVLIKHLIDAYSVGIYSVAVTLSEIWGFIPTIIVVSLFPAILNGKQKSKELYYSRLKKLAFFLIFISLLISIIITILAPILIKTIYGPEFIDAVKILKIYVWANISTFLTALIYNFLISENYKKIIIFMSLSPMIINLVLNIIWIPEYGNIGAAWATFVSYFFGPLTLLLFKKTRQDLSNIFLR